jgi:class 3 adenylate cyclase
MSPVWSEGYLDAERRQATVLFTDMVGFTTFLKGQERKRPTH